jgi:hypothetical protein
MTRISLQFLESAYPDATPRSVRERLRQACQILPIESVLLGWNLPPALTEAVAAEASKQGAALYRWHPLLASDSGAALPAAWQTIAVNNRPITGFRGLPEFTFFCANNPFAQEWMAQRLEKAVQSGMYQGIFFDRMRWPSPAGNLGENLGCFCPHCQALAARNGLDFELVRRFVAELLADATGAQRLVRALVAPENEETAFEAFLQFREDCITRTISTCAEAVHANGLLVGLDCFSPSLMRMVGQNLSSLGHTCNWTKLMTYPHTFGPAGLPYELQGIIHWLEKQYGIVKDDGLQFARQASQINTSQPGTFEKETALARSKSEIPLFIGLALVEMENVNSLSDEQIRTDLIACKSGQPDGLALSWDLWLIPPKRLEMIAQIFT